MSGFPMPRPVAELPRRPVDLDALEDELTEFRASNTPPTRLQEIARLLLELPYGDFVAMSEGIKSQGSTELATLIYEWAKQNGKPPT